ncbi:hypothetical protein Tco_1568839 [Tanacetum coccineum]
MEVILDEEEVAIDVVPLATKPPTIIDWKIHKEGKNNYFQIIRADGSSKMYLVFSQLLKSVDREDLVELYKLVKAKYGWTRLVEDMDFLLWGDLKTKFEPHVESRKSREVAKNGLQSVLSWKLFDSCGVHCLSLQSGMIYMLYKVNAAEGVNAASKEVSTPELESIVRRLDSLVYKREVLRARVRFDSFIELSLASKRFCLCPLGEVINCYDDEFELSWTLWERSEDIEALLVKGGFQPERLARGLEVGLIRRIQGIGCSVLEFLGVGTTFDIFQNIHILYLQYGVLTSSGYGVLIFFPLWSLVSAGTDTPYLP